MVDNKYVENINIETKMKKPCFQAVDAEVFEKRELTAYWIPKNKNKKHS